MFLGNLYDDRLYNRALTATEVTILSLGMPAPTLRVIARDDGPSRVNHSLVGRPPARI